MEQAIEDAIAALLKAWSDQGYSREDLEVEEEGRTITINVPDDNDNAHLRIRRNHRRVEIGEGRRREGLYSNEI